ncbi:MAG: Na+/H+ antiporter subunit E [Methanomicrobiales archaeon]|nr:Na+/H+ antiporter subunit E [Methanomicrobiales archaeon]
MNQISRLEVRILTFSILLLFWMLLSHEVEFFNILGGVASAWLVTAISHDLLVPSLGKGALGKAGRFLLYIPWLLMEILKAGLDVAYRVLHPSMPITPTVVKFEAPFEGDLPRTILANSITLTPGTITIEVDGKEFTVHSLAEEIAEEFVTGKSMQQKIARIFEEEG